MQWVAKKHLPIATALTVFFVALAGGLAISTNDSVTSDSSTLNSENALWVSCFETSTATIRISREVECPAPLISLGGGALVESATATGEVVEIHPLLASRFTAAQVAAARAGVTLYITSGFRTQARQEVLFAEAIKKYGNETEAAKWVLPAHFSHHPQGLAIDVNYPKDPLGAQWLEENGARYGLCRVYANEWWHFEGVIAPGEICPDMAENALVDLR